jgi:hypothetical protein
VGVAAAAGLAIGVIGGQVSARMGMTPPAAPPPAVVTVQAPEDFAGPDSVEPTPIHLPLLEEDLDQLPPALRTLHEMTPRLTAQRISTYGG